jgi:NADPH-dependent 2,4-dienoyl-CoA reductase/sulfur reductase-like enzyme
MTVAGQPVAISTRIVSAAIEVPAVVDAASTVDRPALELAGSAELPQDAAITAIKLTIA